MSKKKITVLLRKARLYAILHGEKNDNENYGCSFCGSKKTHCPRGGLEDWKFPLLVAAEDLETGKTVESFEKWNGKKYACAEWIKYV